MTSNDDGDFTRSDRDERDNRGVTAASGKNGISPSLIGFAVVAVLAVIFFFQNSNRIEVNFWLFDWNTTIRWSLLMAMFLGVLLDRLFGMWWRRRGKKKDEVKQARR
ncbi:MAG: LapA family protein [Actinobacteria bacterium]|nr:LapA family protein [Actinomycetota bacterium]